MHWSTVGDARASDREIMNWASAHQHVVVTQDMDFATILAATRATSPSVILVRAQDTLPEQIGSHVLSAVRDHWEAPLSGAIVVVDVFKSRVRVLPLT